MKSKTGSPTDGTAAIAREKKWSPILARHLKKPRSNLRWYWTLGRTLRKLRPPEIYRSEWVRNVLPKQFKVRPDLGSKAMAFAKSFSAEQVKELTSLGTSWSAIVTVLPVKKSDDRIHLLTEAKEKEWSIRALRARVAQVLIVPRVQNRKPVSPVSSGPQGDVYRLAQDLARWQSNAALWKEAVETLRSDLDLAREGDKFQILIELVEKAEVQLRGLRRDALQLKKALAALREKLKP